MGGRSVTARTEPRLLRVSVTLPIDVVEKLALLCAHAAIEDWAAAVTLNDHGIMVREREPAVQHVVSWRRFAREAIADLITDALAEWPDRTPQQEILQRATFGEVKYG